MTRIWISTDYTVEMGRENIKKYYQEELTNKGWNYKGINNGTLCFTKNDLLFEINIENNKFHTSLHFAGHGPNF
ncbi:MAG: hypothetical protein H6Q69_1281 [Firmicutes bacterium]|nr:hypothetical protein [Bacillota bacterium]